MCICKREHIGNSIGNDGNSLTSGSNRALVCQIISPSLLLDGAWYVFPHRPSWWKSMPHQLFGYSYSMATSIALFFFDRASPTLHWQDPAHDSSIQKILSVDYPRWFTRWWGGLGVLNTHSLYMILYNIMQHGLLIEEKETSKKKQASKQVNWTYTYSDGYIQCAAFLNEYASINSPAHRSSTKCWLCVPSLEAHPRKISLKQHEAVSHLAAWLSLTSVCIFVYL